MLSRKFMHALRFGSFGGASLKTRLTIFTLFVFLIGVWSLTWYASSVLRGEMEAQIGEQQISAASMFATSINEGLEDRLDGLEQIAGTITPEILAKPSSLQDFLERRQLFLRLFNGGIFVTRLDGIAIADVPRSTGRIGINFSDSDFIKTTVKNGTSTIGTPVLGRVLKEPVFGMAAPIRDTSGNVVGVLAGAINLGKPNFLDKVAGSRVGKTGGYLLIAPKSRFGITGTDKSYAMKPLPMPGINPLLDRYISGYEGYGTTVDSRGIGILSAAKQVPLSGWVLINRIPALEALAPIRGMQVRIILASLLFTLAAGLAIWFMTWRMLKHQLSPMITATKIIDSISDSSAPLLPLPVRNRDEIGQLIESFNRLLGLMKQREADKDEALDLLKKITDTVPGVVFQFRMYPDGTSCVPYANDMLREIYRVHPEEVRQDATKIFAAVHPDDLPSHLQSIATSAKTLEPWQNEYRLQFKDEPAFWIAGSAVPQREENGSVLWHGFLMDVTVRKRSEEALRIAATALEAQQGVMITDAAHVILQVNRAFTQITGYTSDESVGRTPQLLASGRHNGAYYAAMYKSLEGTGAWAGEIWNRRKSGEIFPEWLTISTVTDTAGNTTHYVATFSDITSKKEAEDRINNLAFYDPLTQLPNRRLLLDRLKQALSSHKRSDIHGAILFIDLDNFKILNDTLGHNIGDLLLQQVAQRLRDCVRESDTVARLGGDEFVVMLDALSGDLQESIAQCESIGKKILAALNQSYQLDGHVYQNTASIGITLIADQHESVDDLLKRADLAMYQAKSTGRNTLCFFDPTMQASVTSRAVLEAELGRALLNSQFVLFYQAQIGKGDCLVGVEALVRWQHPERGLVPPAEFIPLAEDTGLILPLGLWVLEAACNQLTAWARSPNFAHMTIAVNVSAVQMRKDDFVTQVIDVLDRTGAPPNQLKLELTESLLIKDLDSVIAKMLALKAKGVGFSLDDFGTGYSSLSYLKKLPLDQLKIDQGFVRDILIDSNDAAIAKMVVVLGETLGLSVIAEGVESNEQKEFLSQLGCHAYQGYLYSPPIPLVEFEQYVAATSQM